MIFHDWIGRHSPDLEDSYWEEGHFISHCRRCGREMIKPPGMTWQIRDHHDR
jgi:hypothetical protein